MCNIYCCFGLMYCQNNFVCGIMLTLQSMKLLFADKKGMQPVKGTATAIPISVLLGTGLTQSNGMIKAAT